ncbi:hypothetical protein [Bradyrhizobium sp. BWA-3-5]|uniref:hypothetical protein n=1 Tax=Bradyrhizobium sp. BWA-3-5 TaxID=3080013 RepID=UPI00293F5811|nr:hypothetical protein [Bradyrhizobium sp. BWA-3-5]WOH63842.1 hypothetical protein RX331_24515 [Bradyrhizobium sp. BWA-3-5]
MIRATPMIVGMNGTTSEMDLSIFRQRSLEALKQKAGGGELFLNGAIGYLKVSQIGSRATLIDAFRRCSHSHQVCRDAATSPGPLVVTARTNHSARVISE